MAISSLERRLIRGMMVSGGFGVFHDDRNAGMLHRSLLWCRGSDTTSLPRLEDPYYYAGGGQIPSWSWMAYHGGIDYLEPEFGGIDWAELSSPWASTPFSKPNEITLWGMAYKYDSGVAVEGEGTVIFDRPKDSERLSTLCFVVGKAKTLDSIEERKHYVLLVTAVGETMYERVGVGVLPGTCISLNSFGVTIC